MGKTILTAAILLAISAAVAPGSEPEFHWDPWRRLPVLEGGRAKPLDTLAWESLRLIANRSQVNVPDRPQKLDATAWYLVTLLEWQGWDRETALSQATGKHDLTLYFNLHQADPWDHANLLRVDYLDLRTALGLDKDVKHISPLALSTAKVKTPGLYEEKPFLLWAESLTSLELDGLTTFEQKSLELASRYWIYQEDRMGNRLELIPIPGSTEGEWLSLAGLMRTKFDDATDASGLLRQAQLQFQTLRTAYRNGSADEFNQASAEFLATIQRLGRQSESYPKRTVIDREVLYNRWAPFRFGWTLMAAAFVLLLLSMATAWKRVFYALGWLSFLGGSIAIAAGFALRISITGRAPVTNMYESVVYVGLGVAVFGMLFECFRRKRFVLTAAAAVATVTLILADNCPVALDPSLRPLQPVLRSNFWLVTHVLTITLSYAAFALALGVGNITLGYFLLGSEDKTTINGLTDFTYRSIQAGVLLLAVGTILGGVWADYSWGRFWGWDPKEVWALVALLGYLAVLHARHAGWIQQFGLAALSVLCFALIVMAWYGVNFVLGAGLHSYGFGGGGKIYVFTALILQTVYVLATYLTSRAYSQLA